MFTDRAVDVGGRGVGNQGDVKARKFADGISCTTPSQLHCWHTFSLFATTLTQLGIGNGQGDLLLILNLLEKVGKARGNLSFNDGSNFL